MTLSKRLLLALFLLAAPLAAQDQSLAPNQDHAPTSAWNNSSASSSCAGSTACSNSSTNCTLNVDESPQSADGNIAATASNNQWVGFHFPTPTSSPSTTTDDQTFDITMSRCNASCEESSGGTDPSYDIEWGCTDDDVTVTSTSIATNQTITSLDMNTSHTWTFSAASGECVGNSDGNNVIIELKNNQAGGGGNRRHACVEAVEWEVTHAAAGAPRRLWIVGFHSIRLFDRGPDEVLYATPIRVAAP